MKAFNRLFFIVIIMIIILFIISNFIVFNYKKNEGKPYLVEVSRLVREIENKNLEEKDLEECNYIIDITKEEEDFYYSNNEYVIREIDGELYRFDYKDNSHIEKLNLIFKVNIILGMMSVITISIMFYIKLKILAPFENLRDIPYELSKGNLTVPIKETKNRFFGRFIWGVDMLRENMEEQKERELNLQKDKKMLLLSLSHDIKTPLSAIKLYSKALSKGLYADKEKQNQIIASIDEKAEEIENYVTQIITASREEFLSLEVNNSEFYLSELMSKIKIYYKEKLNLLKTNFNVHEYDDCIINGDLDRSIEVIQNIMENAIKYGDGKNIEISFEEEEDSVLLTIKNTGCTLQNSDLTYMFESFWRGTNAQNEKGSGLGLYICRQLMHKMNGEVFAKIIAEEMAVTVVFGKS
ncbi:MAG: HAMP domain-containing histidine kinase [Clostridia bacterium]|nr:HAMP domain-containing histidine kinase [Clostridia bacterium]